ncbi:MAG: hypothetical protein U0414_33140 [Polyangiaceae bacterium]
MQLRSSDPEIAPPPSSRRAAVRARAPRDLGRIAPPPPSSVGARSPKVPPVHMASLVTTAQNWPLVPNPSSKPVVSAAVEKAAAKQPRMSIDVELDFDEISEPAPLPPVVIQFGKTPAPVIPSMPKRDDALAKVPAAALEAEPPPAPEPRRRPPFAVGFLCLLSVAGSIAIVVLKLAS